ncbi:MAG: hypothetical protein R3A52_13740 [Polyangiales bacterium]
MLVSTQPPPHATSAPEQPPEPESVAGAPLSTAGWPTSATSRSSGPASRGPGPIEGMSRALGTSKLGAPRSAE